MPKNETSFLNPSVYLAYSWRKDAASVVDRIRTLIDYTGFRILQKMQDPGVMDIPDKEAENLLQADAVGVILVPSAEGIITPGVSREIAAANHYEIPIFLMVDQAYVGSGIFDTDLNGFVSGRYSIREWFPYNRQILEKQSLQDVLNKDDTRDFRDWLQRVRGKIQRLDLAARRDARENLLLARRGMGNDALPLHSAIQLLAAASRISRETFLFRLAEVAARIAGAQIGIAATTNRLPGQTQLELQGFWSRFENRENSLRPYFDLYNKQLGYWDNDDVKGLMGLSAKKRQSIIGGRLQQREGPDQALLDYFVNPGDDDDDLAIQSEIAIPIIGEGDRVSLVLDVEDEEPERFLEVHIKVLEALGQIASTMYDRLIANDFAGLVVQLAQGSDSVLPKILDHILCFADADCGFIALRDPQGSVRVRAITETGLHPDQRELFKRGMLFVEEMTGITGKALADENVEEITDRNIYSGPYLNWWDNVRAEIVFPIADLASGAEGIVDLEYTLPRQFSDSFKEAMFLKAKLLLLALPSGRRQTVGARSLAQIISDGEGHQAEFIESFSVEKSDAVDESDSRHDVAKTICGFLNKAGGTLLIGVADNGRIIGIPSNCQSEFKDAKDSYIECIKDYLRGHLEPNLWEQYCNCFIDEIENKSVCCIHVDRSDPATGNEFYFKNSIGDRSLYVRIGNKNEELISKEDISGYINNRWKKQP